MATCTITFDIGYGAESPYNGQSIAVAYVTMSDNGSMLITTEPEAIFLAVPHTTHAFTQGKYLQTLLPNGVKRYVLVPPASTAFYSDLVPVDPSTLTPIAEPEAAWWAAADANVVDGDVVGNDLILTRYNGSTVNAGNVRGPVGPAGPNTIPTNEAIANAVGVSKRLHFLDLYNSPIFAGGANVWVPGQATANVTTTNAVAVGATVLPLSSVAGIIAGVSLVTKAGTNDQQVHRVVSIAGSNATVADPVAVALSTGETCTPLWTNASHLSASTGPGAGYGALAHAVAYATDDTGAYIIGGATPKVTYFGNSWIAIGLSTWATNLQDRIVGAVVTNAGVGGNTSAQMLARFDADIPANSGYVVFNEPGVNDTHQGVSATDQAANLERLVAKIRALGATPIYLGPVPLNEHVVASAAQAAAQAALSNGRVFPKVGASVLATQAADRFDSIVNTPEASSIGVGAPTTLDAITTGVRNAALGIGASGVLAVGADVVAVGTDAGGLSRSGSNTFIGSRAGHTPGGIIANASTTGAGQTLVGFQTGQSTATPVGFITAIGYRTTVAAAGGVSIGTSASGVGAAATAQDEIALGTAVHTTRIRGYLQVDRSQTTVGAAGAAAALPATPSKYLIVKDSAGTEFIVPAYAKA